MTQPGSTPPPGWYHAEGDPAETQRYWDGSKWVGGPVEPPTAGATAMAQPVVMGGEKALPQLGLVLADPWVRIGARLIDSIFSAIIGGVIAILIILPAVLDDVDRNRGFSASFGGSLDDPFSGTSVIATLVGLVVGAAYYIGFLVWKGATPGKLIVGIKVVGQDGESPPSGERAFRRWVPDLVGLLPFVSFVVLILNLVFIFSDDRRRSVYDRVGTTYVVKT